MKWWTRWCLLVSRPAVACNVSHGAGIAGLLGFLFLQGAVTHPALSVLTYWLIVCLRPCRIGWEGKGTANQDVHQSVLPASSLMMEIFRLSVVCRPQCSSPPRTLSALPHCFITHAGKQTAEILWWWNWFYSRPWKRKRSTEGYEKEFQVWSVNIRL